MQRFLLSTAFVLAAGAASAATLTFETPLDFGAQQTSEGFAYDFTASGWFIGPSSFVSNFNGMPNNGTGVLVAAGNRDAQPARVTMSKVGGAVFSVQSLFAASSYAPNGNTLELFGSQQGGGSVTATLTLGSSYSQYMLSGFSNLVSLTIKSGTSGSFFNNGFGIDNVVVDELAAVPAPAALPLLLAGLGGLIALKRRKG